MHEAAHSGPHISIHPCHVAVSSCCTVAVQGSYGVLWAAGLHALVPYFTQLIAEEVQRSLHDLPRLHLLLQVTSLLRVS